VILDGADGVVISVKPFFLIPVLYVVLHHTAVRMEVGLRPGASLLLRLKTVRGELTADLWRIRVILC
jgi:hypothetical protein